VRDVEEQIRGHLPRTTPERIRLDPLQHLHEQHLPQLLPLERGIAVSG